jgi:hypothetical protein
MVKCGPSGARTETERIVIVKACRRLHVGDGSRYIYEFVWSVLICITDNGGKSKSGFLGMSKVGSL